MSEIDQPLTHSKIIYKLVPKNQLGKILLAAFLTALFQSAIVSAAYYLKNYGLVLFIGVPVFCGLMAALLDSYHQPRPTYRCCITATWTLIIVGLILLTGALEGIVCLLMAFPLALPFAWLGAWLGCFLARIQRKRLANLILLVMGMIALPICMGFEAHLDREPPLRKVITSIDIAADEQTVWNSVVAFSPIPEPTEWLFKLGIAYPQRAEIKGTGTNAIRYCIFSTGPFVEPICAWDKPHLLQFNVTENPEPMKETSIYPDIHPPHLHGFMISEKGQFQLIRQPNHHTLLQGTTWYRHKLWPQFYWGIISDNIIHQIHDRVLNHIKLEAERQATNSNSTAD